MAALRPVASPSFRRTSRRLWILALMVPLGGCAAAGIGGAAVVAGAAFQERTMGAAVDDAGIRLAINEAWLRYSEPMLQKLNLLVQEGRVLIVGIVPNPEWKARAVELAQAQTGVKEVIDEIRLGEDQSTDAYLTDSRITATLRSRLIVSGRINPLNYSFEVLDGTIYIIGVGRDTTEIEDVLLEAQSIEGVTEVVSYARPAGSVQP